MKDQELTLANGTTIILKDCGEGPFKSMMDGGVFYWEQESE